MPSKKNSSKSKHVESQSNPQPPRSGMLTRVLFRPRMLAALALAVSATFLVPLAIPHLPDLREQAEYRLPTSEINIRRIPHWVPHDLLDQVIETGGLPQEVSMLDANLTHDVAAAFALHPWVEEVVSVRKTHPARIDVELEFRKPVAMVQVANGMYAVDAHGTLLPPTDFSVADTKKFPVIQNVKSTPRDWQTCCLRIGKSLVSRRLWFRGRSPRMLRPTISSTN